MQCLFNHPTDYSIPVVIDALYIRKYGNQETNSAVTEMFQNIRDQLRITLSDHVKWMDAKTRERAVRKVDAISAVVGAPKELMDDNELERFYEDLNVNCTDRFLETSIQLATLKQVRLLRSLRKPLSSTYDWEHVADATSVGPQFFYRENVIS